MEDAVERIIEKIREDVRWKIDEIERDAEEKIERIKREEYARWEREREKMEHDAEREVEGIKSLIISRANLEGKRELMDSREEVMNKVIEAIKRNARNTEGYMKYIEEKVKEARSVFGEEFVVLCIPEDKAKVDEIVSRIAPRAKIEMGAVKYGGIVVKDVQGVKSIDYSIEALVGRKINDIRKMIVNRLFEGEHA